MKSNEPNRQNLIRAVIDGIESRIQGSLVIWRNSGTPSDDFSDDTEVFEAYMISEDDYESFVECVWDLSREYARPNGFTIMVHDLTPEETREYRWAEYQAELRRREKSSGGLYEIPVPVRDVGRWVLIPVSYSVECEQPSDWISERSQEQIRQDYIGEIVILPDDSEWTGNGRDKDQKWVGQSGSKSSSCDQLLTHAA